MTIMESILFCAFDELVIDAVDITKCFIGGIVMENFKLV